MTTGGEEIQGATLHGRELVLRVRAEIVGSGASQTTALSIETCDEICWRGTGAHDFRAHAQHELTAVQCCALDLLPTRRHQPLDDGWVCKGEGVQQEASWGVGHLEGACETITRGDNAARGR